MKKHAAESQTPFSAGLSMQGLTFLGSTNPLRSIPKEPSDGLGELKEVSVSTANGRPLKKVPIALLPSLPVGFTVRLKRLDKHNQP